MRALIVLIVTMLAPAGWAQEVPPEIPEPADTLITDTIADTMHVDTAGATRVGADTILFVPPPGGREVPVTDTINLERRLRQNPTTALLKSLAVPGWGQFGNGRPLKAAIFIGIDAWFIGAAIHYGNQASEFRDQYEAATDDLTRNQFYDLYRDRRQERNKYFFFLGLATLVGMFDAYVDAHLSGSPIERDDDLTFDIGPDPAAGVRANLSYRF